MQSSTYLTSHIASYTKNKFRSTVKGSDQVSYEKITN